MNARKEPRGHAEVLTWGSKFEGGNGLRDQVRAKLKGGNVGHAAVRISIPIDNQGMADALVQKYCYKDNFMVLPVTKKKLPNGDEFYEVYISAWPGDKSKMTLQEDFYQDTKDERGGVNFNWDPKWAEVLKPSQRNYKGMTGKTTMMLGPSSFMHKRGNVSEKLYQELEAIEKYNVYLTELNNYKFINERLNGLLSRKKTKLGETARIALTRSLPNWESLLKNPPMVTSSELSILIARVNDAKDQYQHLDENKALVGNILQLAKMKLIQIQECIKEDIKVGGKITPKTADLINTNKKLLGFDDVNFDVTLFLKYSKQQAEDLMQHIDTIISSSLEVNAQKHYPLYKPNNDETFEGSFSYGLNPDHVVQIPLNSLSSPRNDGSLDIKGMLKRANQIATSSEKFSLSEANCSQVAGWVLYAGAQNSKKQIFNRKALNNYATPQMVFNNSLKYLREISPKANKNYQKTIDSEVQHSHVSVVKKQKGKVEFVPSLKEITLDGIDTNLSDKNKCIQLMNKFEATLQTDKEIPYLSKDMKLFIESNIRGEKYLEGRFYALCEHALIKAKEQSINSYKMSYHEWDIVNELAMAMDHDGKISKKDHPNLSYSYLILNINGQMTPFRMSHEILGRGVEGKVKIIENRQGEKFAVKVTEAKKTKNSEIAIMKELGAAKHDFIVNRDEKYSKSMGKVIGDKHYIVQPLLDKDVEKLLNSHSVKTDEQKRDLAIKCCKAIKLLHDLNILHRDIKPSNFMTIMDKSGNAKSVHAIDFGGAIKVNEKGLVIAGAFGTPRYMAPELRRSEKFQIGMQWQQERSNAAAWGDKIADAYDQIKMLQDQQKNIYKDLKHDNAMLFENRKKIFKNVSHYDLVGMLNKYDGTNKEEIIKGAVQFAKNKDAVEFWLNDYFAIQDRLTRINESIANYEGIIKNASEKREVALEKVAELYAKLEKEFNKEVPNSFASDIYALGVMFRDDFKLDLKSLGLADMLNDDPSKRPSMATVINALSKNNLDLKQDEKSKENTAELGTVRLPDHVNPVTLKHKINGELSILSPEDMDKLKDIRKQKNAITEVNGKKVFLTEQGSAFVLHSPIGQGATGSTYLVQNVDDHTWSVLKMIQGDPRKIRGAVIQFKYETNALDNLKQLQGTLELQADTHAMHICIQPYVFGKTYGDVIKAARNNGNDSSIENSVMISLKAIESLIHLQNKDYLHRDIKPENMLWDPKTNTCTFIDFGVARKGNGPELEVNDPIKRGSEAYQAPEVDFQIMHKDDRKYNIKTEIYSIGVIIGEILSVTKPSDHPAYHQLQQLQQALTNASPGNRPSPKEALQALNQIAESLPDLKDKIGKGKAVQQFMESILPIDDITQSHSTTLVHSNDNSTHVHDKNPSHNSTELMAEKLVASKPESDNRPQPHATVLKAEPSQATSAVNDAKMGANSELSKQIHEAYKKYHHIFVETHSKDKEFKDNLDKLKNLISWVDHTQGSLKVFEKRFMEIDNDLRHIVEAQQYDRKVSALDVSQKPKQALSSSLPGSSMLNKVDDKHEGEGEGDARKPHK